MDLGNGFGFWKTMPMRRRTSTGSTPGPYRFCPWKIASPSIRAPGTRSFMRLKQRSSVLLPQPDGPMNATTLRSGMRSETDFTARVEPYTTDRLRASSSTSPGGVMIVRMLQPSGVAVAQQDGGGVHGEQHHEEDDAGGRRGAVEIRLRARDPVVDLERDDGELIHRTVRHERDEAERTHEDKRRRLADGA